MPTFLLYNIVLKIYNIKASVKEAFIYLKTIKQLSHQSYTILQQKLISQLFQLLKEHVQ